MNASETPRQGSDTATRAADAVTVTDALGREHFGVVGQDVGMGVGYAVAADHRDRVTRLAAAEAALPGVGYSPPDLSRELAAERLFRFAFNRLEGINEELVAGRESRGDSVLGASVAATTREVASGVSELVLSDCGHFASEEVAGAMGDALNGFFA